MLLGASWKPYQPVFQIKKGIIWWRLGTGWVNQIWMDERLPVVLHHLYLSSLFVITYSIEKKLIILLLTQHKAQLALLAQLFIRVHLHYQNWTHHKCSSRDLCSNTAVIYWGVWGHWLASIEYEGERLRPYGRLILCTAYYMFRKLKQSSRSQRPSANFLRKTAHFSCLPLSCWFGTFSECTELEHCICTFFLPAYASVYVCVGMCWAFVDKHLGRPAFYNHMMTVPREVTVNSEPVLIIACVCFWICFAQSQNPCCSLVNNLVTCLSVDSELQSVSEAVGLEASEQSDSSKSGSDLPPNC